MILKQTNNIPFFIHTLNNNYMSYICKYNKSKEFFIYTTIKLLTIGSSISLGEEFFTVIQKIEVI